MHAHAYMFCVCVMFMYSIIISPLFVIFTVSNDVISPGFILMALTMTTISSFDIAWKSSRLSLNPSLSDRYVARTSIDRSFLYHHLPTLFLQASSIAFANISTDNAIYHFGNGTKNL